MFGWTPHRVPDARQFRTLDRRKRERLTFHAEPTGRIRDSDSDLFLVVGQARVARRVAFGRALDLDGNELSHSASHLAPSGLRCCSSVCRLARHVVESRKTHGIRSHNYSTV
jgi:hypothetical protein